MQQKRVINKTLLFLFVGKNKKMSATQYSRLLSLNGRIYCKKKFPNPRSSIILAEPIFVVIFLFKKMTKNLVLKFQKKQISFGPKKVFLSIFSQSQLFIEFSIFVHFGCLYLRFLTFFSYFSKNVKLKLTNFILSVSPTFFRKQFGENDQFQKKSWDTDKRKLSNFNFKVFKK